MYATFGIHCVQVKFYSSILTSFVFKTTNVGQESKLAYIPGSCSTARFPIQEPAGTLQWEEAGGEKRAGSR